MSNDSPTPEEVRHDHGQWISGPGSPGDGVWRPVTGTEAYALDIPAGLGFAARQYDGLWLPLAVRGGDDLRTGEPCATLEAAQAWAEQELT